SVNRKHLFLAGPLLLGSGRTRPTGENIIAGTTSARLSRAMRMAIYAEEPWRQMGHGFVRICHRILIVFQRTVVSCRMALLQNSRTEKAKGGDHAQTTLAEETIREPCGRFRAHFPGAMRRSDHERQEDRNLSRSG